MQPTLQASTGQAEPVTAGLRWLAVSTHANREATAHEHLARQGFEVYCPRIAKRVRHARQARDVLRPLFPGYLFVKASRPQMSWRTVLSTVGVRTIVRCGEEPSYVDPVFIAAVRAREVDGVVIRPPTPFRVGETVQIAGGAFDGLLATIIEMTEKDRLVVLLDMLSQRVRVKLEVRQARPLPPGH